MIIWYIFLTFSFDFSLFCDLHAANNLLKIIFFADQNITVHHIMVLDCHETCFRCPAMLLERSKYHYVQKDSPNYQIIINKTKASRPNSSVVKHTLSMRESGVRFPGRSKRTQCRQRLATAAPSHRRCVAQALGRVGGPAIVVTRFGAIP